MMIFRILAGTALALGVAGAAAAQDLGACAWSKLPASEQAEIVAAYQHDLRAAGGVMKTHDSEIKAAAAACASRPDIPAFWVQTAAGAEAMQVSMAATVQAATRLDRRALDRAWAGAPVDVKDCVRAAAAKTYRLPIPACADPKAPIWLLQQLRIVTMPQGRETANAALLYFAAKGHSEYADALIARFERGG